MEEAEAAYENVILNTDKLQDHRFTMLLPQIKSLFWIKNLMRFQWFPQDYSSLLTEYIKPETMPCPLKGRGARAL